MLRVKGLFRHAGVAAAACLLAFLSGRAEAQNGNHRWSAFVSGRGGLLHNGLSTPLGSARATDSLASVAGSLAYSRYTRSSLFTVSGYASNLFLSDFDFNNFGASVSGYKDFNDKASFRFGGGGSKGFNYNDLIVNSVFLLDQDIITYYATAGTTYEFSTATSAFADVSYSRFRFELTQNIDGSQFAFLPFDDDALNLQLPDNLPFSSTTAENVLDVSTITAALLATEGTVLSQFTTDIYALSSGISHQLSNRTQLSGRGGYRWLTYRRPSVAEGADWYAGARLEHEFNTKTDASLEYLFRENLVVAPRVDSHTASGMVDRQLTVPLRVNASFGFTYIPDRGTPSLDGFGPGPEGYFPSSFLYIGGAGLSGQFTRTTFSIDYRHQAQHSIGIGRFLTSDFGSGGLSHVFARDWFGYGYVGYRFSRGTFDDNFSFGVLVAGGDLRYRINEDFSLGASYLFRRLDRDADNLNTHMLSAVLSFGKTWR